MVAEHSAAQPELAEYILDQAWSIVISHSEGIWATDAEIAVIVTHLPFSMPELSRFSRAE